MNILHIDSSPRQESHSRALSAAIVEKLLKVAPGARITRRDLGADPLPQTEALYAAALASPATLAAPPMGSLDLSEVLIREVEAADVIVIGTPMHNLTIPSVLKAWIDQILRVGRTMKSTPSGKVGMLQDRPVFIGAASGGFFAGERANQPDFLTPYLSLALSSIGLRTQQFLPLQGTAFLDWSQAPLARDKALTALDLTVVGQLRGVAGRPAALSSIDRPYRDAPLLSRASPGAF
ncbi:FMN-dependent NADH-azoreductase [Rhizobium leguminosarum]|uniref:FMN-dependent NADH-azoreductase n=1 Tax=Rhizobium leguminosarum TaxID=384 RepID=UPI001C984082|nr:NAD(P)H-dependent oxidoreductase [Rhizobium leguminosarum]MBY5427889.1 flavodoxin family protein [Rhizobium leguminosarum]MBY5466351.1 flavodoxin family protein [Rhizobium leguminosarum]